MPKGKRTLQRATGNRRKAKIKKHVTHPDTSITTELQMRPKVELELLLDSEKMGKAQQDLEETAYSQEFKRRFFR